MISFFPYIINARPPLPCGGGPVGPGRENNKQQSICRLHRACSLSKTERITILGTPGFKAFLAGEAQREGISLSELVRRRCMAKPATGSDRNVNEPPDAALHDLVSRVERLEKLVGLEVEP